MFATFVFFAVLSVLVLVHELGHFWTARKSGVICEEFGFGFPPRIAGIYKDKSGKRRIVWGNKEVGAEQKDEEETVYSINLIPLGGFVKIHGEDGSDRNNKKSFGAQSFARRFLIISAGVIMNFLLAVVLFAAAAWLGMSEAIDPEQRANYDNVSVKLSVVAPNSPAQEAGLQMGDDILALTGGSGEEMAITSVKEFQELIEKEKGKEVKLKVKHPGEEEAAILAVTPRVDPPEGQGALGVGLAEVAFVKHNLWESIVIGFKTTFGMVLAILYFLYDLIKGLFVGKPVGNEVTGPVGIAIMSGQVAKMGWAFIFQFAAMLSVNLAVINFLPLPALDGGRALFLVIEKIKGSPVNQKFELMVHTIGFFSLILLMILITVKDFSRFDLIGKLTGLF